MNKYAIVLQSNIKNLKAIAKCIYTIITGLEVNTGSIEVNKILTADEV